MAAKIWEGSRVIGSVENSTFRKAVCKSKHQLRQPPAWCLSVGSLEAAERAGGKDVLLFEKEESVYYRATIEHIWRNGKRIERAGFEPQIMLPLTFWTRQKPNKDAGPSTAKEPPAAPVQFKLF